MTPMISKRLLPIIAVTGAALVGCGADDPDGAADVTIRSIDYAFLDVPQSVPAGATLALSNESADEAHEIVAVQLPDDETRPVAELVRLPPEELEPLMAGLRTVVLAAPETDGVAVVGDGSLSEPGRYALLCVIPTGADPEEYMTKAATSDGPPDVTGGPPHIVKGMFAELTVTA